MPCCRVFGTAFAEMPFIATREGYRRDGNLTRFMEASTCIILDPMCLISSITIILSCRHSAMILQMAIFKPCILVTQRQECIFSGALHPATFQLSCRAITAHTLKVCC